MRGKIIEKKDLKHETSKNELQASDFAHRIYWTNEARGWDQTKRRRVLIAVREFVERKTFDANQAGRKFHIPQVDKSLHSGPSLLALIEVLRALEAFYDRWEK